MKVLIVVTHLLGTGHLRRALTLAQGFAKSGHQVTLVSGGMPVAGLDIQTVRFVQLPPLASDGTNFTTLLTGDRSAASAAYLARRHSALLACLDDHPDVLITELYPFGRRVLSAEFTALLETAKAQKKPPKILCSIRDILAPPSNPAKAQNTDQVVAAFYDAVLVHSDQATTPLEISWPVSDALRPKLHYTGFVAPPAPAAHPNEAGLGEVLVSAGGGAVGMPVFQAAVQAAKRTRDLKWRLLVGGNDRHVLRASLQHDAPPNVHIEPTRPDFRQMLNHAACSVNLAGYNTVMDLLQTGTPALLIPFDDGGEVEQALRAQSLAARPGFDVLPNAALTPATLAERVTRLIKTKRRAPQNVAMDGAAETVRIVEHLVEQDP